VINGVGVVQGKPIIHKVEPLKCPSRYVRVQTKYSVASVGTELAMIQRSANSADDKEVVRLGYSSAGVVIESGSNADYEVGERVAVYGAPYVWHGEELVVPRTLVARISEDVSYADAATVGHGAIAIHALRSANVQFGEHIVVIGLGLIGLLIAKLARAAGCFVIASEPDETRRSYVDRDGIQAVHPATLEDDVARATGRHGADSVFIAVGTANSNLLNLAVGLCRLRGTVSVVSGAEACLPRNEMFQREVRLIVPQAGGPGRYQTDYEKEARDYPYSEVRWTEGRNMQLYMDLLGRRYVSLEGLLPNAIPLAEAPEGYKRLQGETGAKPLTMVISYT